MRWVWILLVTLLSSVAALCDVQSDGENAIRDLISDYGDYYRVSFYDVSESFLSINESKVSGRGEATRRRDNRRESFTFSIKVRPDGQVRDGVVRFRNGTEYSTTGNWHDPDRPSAAPVRFSNPRNNSTVRDRDGDVEFRGDGPRDTTITVRVYDSNGRERARKSARSNRYGFWSMTLRLGTGGYRAEAEAGRNSDATEIRFRVDRQGDDWDDNNDRDVRFSNPRSNATIRDRDGEVEFRGNGPRETTVTVTVYDSGNRERSRKSVRANRSGSWSTTMRLGTGNYRAVASAGRGESSDDVRFRVDRQSGGWGRPPSDVEGDVITITQPRSGQTFSSSTIKLMGSAADSQVDIRIYRGSRRVYSGKAKVTRFAWAATVNLNKGSYRMTVSGPRSGFKSVDFSIQ